MMFTIDGIAIGDKHLTEEVTELVRITEPELLSPRHAERRWGRSAVVTAVVIGAVAIAMLVSAHAFAAPSGDSSPAANAQHACRVVLGFDPSQAPYQDCVANISRNLPAADPPVLASMAGSPPTTQQKARLACADAGLDPLGGAFRQCVLDVNQSLSDQSQIYR